MLECQLYIQHGVPAFDGLTSREEPNVHFPMLGEVSCSSAANVEQWLWDVCLLLSP